MEEIVMYKTKDGTIFDKKHEAIKHEISKMSRNEIKKKADDWFHDDYYEPRWCWLDANGNVTKYVDDSLSNQRVCLTLEEIADFVYCKILGNKSNS